MKPITYTSDQGVDYTHAISKAKTLADLRSVCLAYRLLVADAREIVDKMTEADFKEWRKVLRLERKGKFSGLDMVEKYGALLIPGVIFQVALMAGELKAPWGLVYIRCKEVGLLEEKQGIAIWHGKKNTESGTDQPNNGRG